MSNVVIRNSEAETLICAARKNFIQGHTVSESSSKTFICHFSDIHGDWERLNHILELLEYYKPDFAIHTGDLVTWNSADNTDYFFHKTNVSSVPVFNSIGNHETFGANGLHAGGPHTNEYLHERYISPLKNIHTNAHKGWYYTDFPSRKLRLIVLNPYEYFSEADYQLRGKCFFLQEQCDWFISTLQEAAWKEYAVMVASHEFAEEIPAAANNWGFCQRFSPYPWGMPRKRPAHYIIEDIVEAFRLGTALDCEFSYELIQQKIAIHCCFEKKGEFICYLAGHRHGDYVGYLPSHPSQLSITMTCSGCFPPKYHNIGEELSDLPRIPRTICEDAVNFYIIDQTAGKISIIRIGASMNDQMQVRRFLALPYLIKC